MIKMKHYPLWTIYFSLGSNRGNPEEYLNNALTALKNHPKTKNLYASTFIWTPFEGIPGEPECLNAAGKIQTFLSPPQFLTWTQSVELAAGRRRYPGSQHAGRELDIDLLFAFHHEWQKYVGFSTKKLRLPHPLMYKRSFVLLPLLNLEPDLVLPNGQNIKELCKK